MATNKTVWIGFDPREAAAFAVAKNSIQRHSIAPYSTRGISLQDLRRRGLYTRETEHRGNGLFDVISDAPMSTEFAISRFLVPHLAKAMFNVSTQAKPDYSKRAGWALFVDADVMLRRDLNDLFKQADDKYAVMVVKHNFNPPEGLKMDGQLQLRYARKNWSSVMLFNCDHPANAALTPELVNTLPGRDLHRFCWLDDSEIGELGPEWNFLVGFHDQHSVPDPSIVHFTDGIPSMPGYEDCPYADEWWSELEKWALK